jgi:hypothetical protein
MEKEIEGQNERTAPGHAFAAAPSENPFLVPAAYFDSFPDTVLLRIKKETDPKTEPILSPLLASLKKENPFDVPEGYFRQALPLSKYRTSIIRLGGAKNMIRYAAAACITLALGYLLFLFNPEPNHTDYSRKPASPPANQLSEESVAFYFQGLEDWTGVAEKDDFFSEGNLLVDLNRESITNLLSGITEQGMSQFMAQASPNEVSILMIN